MEGQEQLFPPGQCQVLSVLLLGEDTAALFHKPRVLEVPRKLKLISVKTVKGQPCARARSREWVHSSEQNEHILPKIKKRNYFT